MEDTAILDKPEEYLCKALDEYSHDEYLAEAAGDSLAPLRPALFTLHKNELKSIIKQQAYLVQRRAYIEALLKLA